MQIYGIPRGQVSHLSRNTIFREIWSPVRCVPSAVIYYKREHAPQYIYLEKNEVVGAKQEARQLARAARAYSDDRKIGARRARHKSSRETTVAEKIKAFLKKKKKTFLPPCSYSFYFAFCKLTPPEFRKQPAPAEAAHTRSLNKYLAS